MRKLLKFNEFLYEAQSAESIESPEMQGEKMSLIDLQSQMGSVEKSDKMADPHYSNSKLRSSYEKDLKDLIMEFSNKTFKVPEWGFTKPASFALEKYADDCWSITGPGKGAGFWAYSKRLEKGNYGGDYFPEVFIQVIAGRDAKSLNFEWLTNENKKQPLKILSTDPNSFNGFITIYKRVGDDFDYDTEQKFSMEELVKIDPKWKEVFKKLIDLSRKYGIQTYQ
jgi:hypothetical protein